MTAPNFAAPNKRESAPRMRPAPGFAPRRSRLSQYTAAGGLLLGLLPLLMSESPLLSPALRMALILAGSFWLFLLLALCHPQGEARGMTLRGVLNPLLLIFLLWCALAAWNAPYRPAALLELLRVLDGALVYFIVAFGMRRPQEPFQAVFGLVGMGVALCLYNFLSIGESGGPVGLRTNAFGTHENFGSLTLLLLPMTLAFAVSGDVKERVRIAALAATPILAGSLLLSLTRSAWIGFAVSLFVLIPLSVRYGAPKSRPRKADGGWRRFLSASLGSPTFLIAFALVAFVGVGGVASTLSHRAWTLADQREDEVLGDRLVKWRGAARMASERPLTGWGLGSFLMMQARWTHQGDDETEVLTKGTGHQNIAHNFYVQWAADAGGIGVTLYVALITAFLLVSFRVPPAVGSDPAARVLRTGCIATVIGASIDAIGSPSYNFHGVSSVLWLFIGAGVAAMRAAPGARAAGGTPGRSGVFGTPPGVCLLSLTVGGIIAAMIIGLGLPARRWGRVLPPGRFEVIASPAGRDLPGTGAACIARFTDANGDALSTMPGVVWRIEAASPSVPATPERSGPVELFIEPSTGLHLSVLRSPSPATGNPLTVTARYKDSDNRSYEASVLMKARDSTP